MNDGRPISRTLRLRAHDLLIATNRDTSGRGYLQLREALERLQGTQIATNIITGGKETFDLFSLIDRARIVRENPRRAHAGSGDCSFGLGVSGGGSAGSADA
jgi:plasmid replication initiation protein